MANPDAPLPRYGDAMAEGAPRRPGPAAGFPPLPARDECHVWMVTAPELEAGQEHLLSLLGPDERARAARYRSRLASQLFFASRAAQRILAGRYLGRDPASVLIDRRCQHCGDEQHGRPHIAGAERGGLDFSVTHTGELLLLAHVSHGHVGIDAEEAGRRPKTSGLIRAAMTPAEAESLAAVPESCRDQAFCRLWVRKEALLKLTGHGIAVRLRSIDVTRDEIPAGSAEGIPGWPVSPVELTDLSLGTPEYVAAIATTLPARRVTVRRAAPFLTAPPR